MHEHKKLKLKKIMRIRAMLKGNMYEKNMPKLLLSPHKNLTRFSSGIFSSSNLLLYLDAVIMPVTMPNIKKHTSKIIATLYFFKN